MALEDLLVFLSAGISDLGHQSLQAGPLLKAGWQLRQRRLMIAFWQLGLDVSDALQEAVHRKRNLEPPDSVIRSGHLIKGFEKCSDQHQDQVLFSAEHPGALAELAVFSGHLQRQF